MYNKMKKLFSIICLLPLLAAAQVVVTSPVAGSTSTSNVATYSMASFTPTANSLLVLMVYATATNPVSPAVTNTGTALTWTLEKAQLVGTNSYYIFWAKVGPTVSASVITFTCTGDNATGCQMSVHTFTNYNKFRANPIRQSLINTATTTSASPAFTFASAPEPSNGYVIGWSGTRGANASTPPAGWTESVDLTYNTPTTNFATARRNGGLSSAGPYTFTASASTAWVTMGVEVYVARRGMLPHLLN